MKHVDEARRRPNTCITCKTHGGPFVDTLRNLRGTEDRIYVCVSCAESIGEVAGMATATAFNAMCEQLDAAEERVSELERVEIELRDLRLAVNKTLYAGAVVVKGRDHLDDFKLRPVPGQPTPVLDET